MEEQWAPMVGYVGYYEVSSAGRVKSLKNRGRRRHDRILVPQLHHSGYLTVCICLKRQSKTFMIHRLVAEAFISVCPFGLEVNHKDGNKQNNHVTNLEYVTPSQNIRHAIENGLTNAAKGERVNTAKLTSSDVVEIRKLASSTSMQSLADMYNVTKQAIWMIVHRKNWKHIE